MKKAIDYLFNEIPYGWVLFPLLAIMLICFSCDLCHAQAVKPTKPPVLKPTPTPATPEDWSSNIGQKPGSQSFVTKKSVVAIGDKAEYDTEKIVQDPLAAGAVKGVKWTKKYKIWVREDGKKIPLSQGWSAEIINSPVSVVVKPTVGVFK